MGSRVKSETFPALGARLNPLLLIWLLWSGAYAGVYFYSYFRNMAVYFLDLPRKAPALWRWLDFVF